jgi:hypothetical protein
VTLPLFLILFHGAICQEISFTKVTSGAIVNDGGWNYAMSWADFNGDDLPDLFVTNNDANNGQLNFLYLNNGDGTFEKITEGPVVNDGGSSYSCSAADVNGDGFTDLFVANYNENNFLYFSNGDGTFEKVTQGPVVSNGGKSAGASWADYDLDGYADLYVANRDQQNFLYHGLGGGFFEKITSGSIVTESANSSGCAWGDYDNDGYPDLYVANSGAVSRLFHNSGDGTFALVEEYPFSSDLSSCSGASWGDCDNDGDLDLFVSTGQLGMYNNWFYLNNGDGTFTKVTDSPLVNDATWSSGSAWGDYDKDGDLDLAVGGYDGDNLLFSNDGNGNFTTVESNAFVNDGNYTEGLAWADVDNDGDLDIFTAKNNYFGGNNSFFLNDGNENNWLKVKAVGYSMYETSSEAFGARIYVYATISGQFTMQMREISFQSGGGQGGQNERIQFFGLGDATMADSVVVKWMGETFSASDVAANQTKLMELSITHTPEILYTADHEMDVYPNPSSGDFTVYLTDPKENGTVRIINIAGQEVCNFPSRKLSGTDHIRIIPGNHGMTPGIYFIHLVTGQNITTEKIVLTD